jgi:putative ABC transport system substrate-binding protein
MNRRQFLGALGSAAVYPVESSAQQAAQRFPKIGIIFTFESENSQAFFRGLRAAGYDDGRNAEVVPRFYGNALDKLDDSARELVALKCSVIFASNPYAIQKAVSATNTIPIVGVDLESDPVASGLAKSMARPGGNFTGFFLDIPELGGKQIELLIEAVPTVSRLGVLWDETIGTVQFHATETARRPKGVTLQSLPIRRSDDINSAFERAVGNQVQGIVALSSPLIFAERSHIADVGNESSAAHNQFVQYVCKVRWIDGLRSKFSIHLRAGCGLCRSHSGGRTCRRFAHPEAGKIRTWHQSQDCKGARPNDSGNASGPCRRSD